MIKVGSVVRKRGTQVFGVVEKIVGSKAVVKWLVNHEKTFTGTVAIIELALIASAVGFIWRKFFRRPEEEANKS